MSSPDFRSLPETMAEKQSIQTYTPPADDYASATRLSTPVEEAIDAEAEPGSPRSSTPMTFEKGIETPPNGGSLAWLQVLGSFFLFFNCWGSVNTFGAFQTYYESNPDWSETASNISWIGSIQAFLLLMIGVVTGPIYDKGYFKALIIAGTFLIVLGYMMTSLTNRYWQVVLAQGVVIGLGNGCLWVPSVAILPQYFTTRKALANGIAAAGSSTGGVIYPLVFRRLEQTAGFGWACRILGFIALATLAISITVMKQRVMPKQKRTIFDFSGFKEPAYALYCLATFLAFISFYGPIYYLSPFAIENRITSRDLGFYLLPILNAASIPGRIIPNFIGDKIGPLNILIPCSFMTGVVALTWIAVHDIPGIITYSCFYGFFSGAFISIAPVCIVAITSDLRQIGTRMGMNFFVSSFGLLIGTPITGAILSSSGSWLGPQLWSGILLMATACVAFAARTAHVGLKLKAKT